MVGTESSKVKEVVTSLGGEILNFSMILDDVDVYTLHFPEANTLDKLRSVILKFKSYKEVDFAEPEVLVNID